MKPMMLVVEDEPFVRMDFVDQAQQAGFETARRAVLLKLLIFSSGETTSGSWSLISVCQEKWMGWRWRTWFATDGLRQS
jgi:hypothetical protein